MLLSRSEQWIVLYVITHFSDPISTDPTHEFTKAIAMTMTISIQPTSSCLVVCATLLLIAAGANVSIAQSTDSGVEAAEDSLAAATELLEELTEYHERMKRDYGTMEACLTKAREGDGYAMQKMAGMYLLGDTVEKSLEKAAHWYEQAAEKGFEHSMGIIGACYRKGLGVDIDNDKALHWLELATREGNHTAMTELGMLLSDKNSGHQDETRAFTLFLQAALKGSETAMYELGWCYHAAIGVKQNDVKARQWMSKAAQAESPKPDVLRLMGHFHEKGIGGDVDIEAAKDWYRKGRDAGSSASMYSLAKLLIAENRFAEAHTLLLQASSLGNKYAFGLIGDLYLDGKGVPQDPDVARDWYAKGADAGSSKSMYKLARSMINDNPKRENELALMWIQKAIDAGHPCAMDLMGLVCQGGFGGKRANKDAAIRWYQQAVKNGCGHAKGHLAKLAP
ncbi:MAG: tetratricopeptide repeat protein [Rubripirellula sp.]